MRNLARHDAGRSQGSDQRPDAAWFCTHCGAVQDEAPQRVCTRCAMGVLLCAAREALGEAFLVVTLDMRVSAASVAAEPLVGDDVVGLPLLAVLAGDDELARAVGRAALGSRRIAATTVAAKRSGRRLDARVAWCGNPPAALIVLQDDTQLASRRA